MKNLVIDLLIKMAKVDVQAKELTAQVEAQSLLLAALVLTVGKGIPAAMSTNIQKAILSATEASDSILQSDAELLLTHFDRLISVSHFVEENNVGNQQLN